MRPLVLVALLLAGCGTLAPAPVSAPDPAAERFAYVVLGEDGTAVARVLTDAPGCPPIAIDGRQRPMQVRAAAGSAAPRTPGAAAATFPILACEAALPPGTKSAAVAGRALALPKAEARRIVVIGDTGCRLAAKDARYQDCNDPKEFPFATIAAAAAAWKPDLVVHVGDYHYREDPCPASRPGCAGSPHGYGWDTWRADLFLPGRVLLEAAPWVAARGNHEMCQRAGQGFWRFVDPRPLLPGRDCNDAAHDLDGNHSDPYAVPLGGDAQLIVFDTSNTSWKGLPPGDPRRARLAATWRKMEALSRRAGYNIGVNHHAPLGILATRGPDHALRFNPGDQGLLDAFTGLGAGLLPPRIDALLSGHAHLWEQVSYAGSHPSQFIAGFSGTDKDLFPLPADMPKGNVVPGLPPVEHFSSWVGEFGFMTLERRGPRAWEVKVWDRGGALRNSCTLEGAKSRCALAQVR